MSNQFPPVKESDLICAQKEFEEIHEAIDKARKNAKNVTVNRQALLNLLIDHSNVLGKVGIEYE